MLSYYISILEQPGERERLSRLYRTCWRLLLGLAARYLSPGPQAEDVVQEAFEKLARHLPELWDRSDQQLTAWLAVVVKHTALDILRRQQREIPLEGSVPEPAAPADEGEFHALVALIRSMPEEYRQVLELRFVAEWSLAEISEALGIRVSTVKTRIFRGRKLLIEQLRKEGYLDGRACI